jgi:hypothetical protein
MFHVKTKEFMRRQIEIPVEVDAETYAYLLEQTGGREPTLVVHLKDVLHATDDEEEPR